MGYDKAPVPVGFFPTIWVIFPTIFPNYSWDFYSA